MFLYYYDLCHVQVPYGEMMAHWNVCMCMGVYVHTYVCIYVHFKHPQYSWQKSNYRDAELRKVVHRFNQYARYLKNVFSWYPLKCNLSMPTRKIWPALHWFSWKWNMISSIMCTILLKNFTHIREYTYIYCGCAIVQHGFSFSLIFFLLIVLLINGFSLILPSLHWFLFTAPVLYIIQIGWKIYKIWAKLQHTLKQSIAFTASIFIYITHGQ
jgi:hypothetical protein